MAAVDALLQKVVALEQGALTAASASVLASQLEELTTAHARTASELEALRQRLDGVSADVETTAALIAARGDATWKEVEHRVVFVPADTQEPQLKQHQRVRAT